MLEGLEQQGATEGRVITASDRLEPSPFVVGQGILGLDFVRGEEAVIARVGGTFDRGHRHEVLHNKTAGARAAMIPQVGHVCYDQIADMTRRLLTGSCLLIWCRTPQTDVC